MKSDKNNTYIFLRHGETTKDLNVPVVNWVLTDNTQESLNTLASKSTFNNVGAIYSSCEHKAVKSAEPFAKELGLSILDKKD